MRFSDPTINEMLTNSDPKRLLIFCKVQFPSSMILAHTGVGLRTYNNESYLGVGNMVKIGSVSDNSKKSANKLTLSVQHTDNQLFSQVMNDNPIGGLCELHLVALDENRQIIGGDLLFSGEISDYNLEKGTPYTISVTASDWFEVWGKPIKNSKVTDASQKNEHPTDEIFSHVERLSKGIKDTSAGNYIGGGMGSRGGKTHRHMR